MSPSSPASVGQRSRQRRANGAHRPSMNGETCPPLRVDASAATAPRSNSVTPTPRRANWSAMESPMAPPPITMTSLERVIASSGAARPHLGLEGGRLPLGVALATLIDERELQLGGAAAKALQHEWREPARPHVRADALARVRSEEHTSELQSHHDLVCRPLL